MKRTKALQLLKLTDKNPTPDEIKTAYRKLSKQYHPDVSKDPHAALKFMNITEAYHILLEGGEELSSFYDKFNIDKEELYRQAQEVYKREKIPRPDKEKIRYGAKHLSRIKMPLECFLLGAPYVFNIDVIKACPECYGNSELWIPCKICDETGYTLRDTGFNIVSARCRQCEGKGWMREFRCNECNGRREVVFNRTVEVVIPSDYKLGTTLVLKNQGNIGWKTEDGQLCLQPQPDMCRLENLSPEEQQQLRDLLQKG